MMAGNESSDFSVIPRHTVGRSIGASGDPGCCPWGDFCLLKLKKKMYCAVAGT